MDDCMIRWDMCVLGHGDTPPQYTTSFGGSVAVSLMILVVFGCFVSWWKNRFGPSYLCCAVRDCDMETRMAGLLEGQNPPPS